jgi:hypothetical protein
MHDELENPSSQTAVATDEQRDPAAGDSGPGAPAQAAIAEPDSAMTNEHDPPWDDDSSDAVEEAELSDDGEDPYEEAGDEAPG